MFLMVGLGVGLTLISQLTSAQLRKLKRQGEAGAEHNFESALSGASAISFKGGLSMFVPMLVGHGLDLLTGTTIWELFG